MDLSWPLGEEVQGVKEASQYQYSEQVQGVKEASQYQYRYRPASALGAVNSPVPHINRPVGEDKRVEVEADLHGAYAA
jgi:hypothetical protein